MHGLMHGILLIDKPKGTPSAILCRKIGRKYNIKRIGHCGTLDPDATGLLVVCVNEATKIVSYLTASDKVYEGTCVFGIETDTQDTSGKILNEDSDLRLSDEVIQRKMTEMMGWQDQLPPMYSAVKREGKRLYKYARNNEVVEREPRKIYVHDFQWIHRQKNEVRFRVHCSKGTYIRTLFHDLGRGLGTYACLKDLRRVASGLFNVENAVPFDSLETSNLMKAPHWLSLGEVLTRFPHASVSPAASKGVKNGITPRFQDLTSTANIEAISSQSRVFMMDDNQSPLAIVQPQKSQQVFKLIRVFNC